MRFPHTLRFLTLTLALTAAVCAQQPANEVTAVPRLIRFNGTWHSQAPTVGATFSIYRGQDDGTPLWSEIQNVHPDKDGNYTVLLGSTRSDGMPPYLFNSTGSRWLEVEIDLVKEERILLGSVPYALKSADADTLGGLPASAYLRVNPPTNTTPNSTTNNVTTVVTAGLSPLANNGTPNYIAMFTNTTDLINSVIYQTGNAVSIGGTANLGAMTLIGNVPSGDTAGMALYNQGGLAGASVSLDMYNTTGNGGIPQAKIKALDDGNYSDHLTFWTKIPGAPTNAVTERLRITSTGNVGIGTPFPSQKLEVAGAAKFDGGIVFGDGTAQTTATLTGPQGPAGPAGTSQWTTNGSNIYYNSGNVGIGTAGPFNKLDVSGGVSIGTYAGSPGGATNGLVVSGSTGIGTNSPQALLHLAVNNYESIWFDRSANSGSPTLFSTGVTYVTPGNEYLT